jgi:hypothetical protein
LHPDRHPPGQQINSCVVQLNWLTCMLRLLIKWVLFSWFREMLWTAPDMLGGRVREKMQRRIPLQAHQFQVHEHARIQHAHCLLLHPHSTRLAMASCRLAYRQI